MYLINEILCGIGLFRGIAILIEIALIILWLLYTFKAKKNLMPLLIGFAFTIFLWGFVGFIVDIQNGFREVSDSIEISNFQYSFTLSTISHVLWKIIYSCRIMFFVGVLSIFNSLVISFGAVLGKKS